MSLETKILQRYRLHYPKDSFREISNRTGIQITRVFRLFSGKSMKIKEFEAFDNAIQIKISENPSYNQLLNLIEESTALLTHTEFERIQDYIERKLNNKKFVRSYIRPLIEEAHSA